MDTPVLDAIRVVSANEWIALGHAVLRIAAIIMAAWVVSVVANHAIRTAVGRIGAAARGDRRERFDTLGRVVGRLVSALVMVIAATAILEVLGISLTPILATAGLAGVAVGLGAQSLLKDYINGLFLLVDDQLRQGEVVQIAGIGGSVEEVTLRYIRLRDYNGHVHFVPNGQIGTVTNRTRDFAFAVMDVGIAYRESVREAIKVMRSIGLEMRADATFGPRILEDLEIAGVNEWAGSAVVIRCRFKVDAVQQWGVRREYLERLKAAFDAHDIEIPYPHLTVYAGEPKLEAAPAFNVRSVPGVK
jgi:moderate conductance mechanosensitive channel